MKLLSSPAPIQGESWAGYLLRIADGNAMCGLSSLSFLLGTTARRLLVANERDVLTRLGFSAHPTEEIASPSLSRRERYLRIGRTVFHGVCPHCLREDACPHIRAAWEMPLEVGCERHSCELLLHCDACGRKISALRSRLLTCDCGRSFACSTVAPLGPTWLQLKRILVIDAKRSGCAFARIPASEVCAAHLLRRLARCIDLSEGPRTPAEPGLHVRLDSAVVNAAYPWFADWPASFTRTCEWAAGRSNSAAELLRTTDFSSLTCFEEHSGLLRRMRSASSRRRCALESVASRESGPLLSLHAAAAYSGIQYSALRSGVRVGNVQVSERKWRNTTLISLEEARRLRRLGRWLATRQVRQRTGLTTSTLVALGEAGYLQFSRVGSTAASVRFEPLALEHLWQELVRGARISANLGPEERTRCFPRHLNDVARREPGALRSYIDRAIRGDVLLVSRSRNPRSWSDLEVVLNQGAGC